jgi:hypothetical protein
MGRDRGNDYKTAISTSSVPALGATAGAERSKSFIDRENTKGADGLGPFDFRYLMVAGVGFEPTTFGL